MGMGHDVINATARGSHTRQRDDAEHRAVQAAMNTDGRDATIHSRVLQGDGRRPVCASPIVCRSNGKHQICGWLGWSRLWRPRNPPSRAAATVCILLKLRRFYDLPKFCTDHPTKPKKCA